MSIEPIPLAAIVERAAGLALAHDVRVALRKAIGEVNARLAKRIAEVKKEGPTL